MISTAICVATKAHLEGVDKSGQPYILHPLAVMLMMEPSDVEGRVVALLHDTLEDTTLTEKDLLEAGFGRTIVDAVVAISKLPDEKNIVYWGRVKRNAIARRVKLKDMEHNCSEARMSKLSEKEQAYLKKKYAELKEFLGAS